MVVDIVTSDANSACNRLSKKQWISLAKLSAVQIVTGGFAEVFNAQQKGPKYGSKSTLETDPTYSTGPESQMQMQATYIQITW